MDAANAWRSARKSGSRGNNRKRQRGTARPSAADQGNGSSKRQAGRLRGQRRKCQGNLALHWRESADQRASRSVELLNPVAGTWSMRSGPQAGEFRQAVAMKLPSGASESQQLPAPPAG